MVLSTFPFHLQWMGGAIETVHFWKFHFKFLWHSHHWRMRHCIDKKSDSALRILKQNPKTYATYSRNSSFILIIKIGKIFIFVSGNLYQYNFATTRRVKAYSYLYFVLALKLGHAPCPLIGTLVQSHQHKLNLCVSRLNFVLSWVVTILVKYS